MSLLVNIVCCIELYMTIFLGVCENLFTHYCVFHEPN